MRNLKRTLAAILAIAMVLTTVGIPVVSAASFDDTAGHWAETYIDTWTGYDVIHGDGNGLFRPDDAITRAEVAQVTQNVIGYVTAAGNSFTDVDPNAWYADAVLKLVAAGTLKGNGDGTMTPEAFMTREEAMTMLARAYGLTPDNTQAGITQYADYTLISDYATGYIGAMTASGYVNGYEDGTIRPQDCVSRAEFVKMLDNMIKLYITAPGTYGPLYVDGLVLVKSGGVTLNGVTAKGLIISPQVSGNVDYDSSCQFPFVNNLGSATVNGSNGTGSNDFLWGGYPQYNNGGWTGGGSGGGGTGGVSSYVVTFYVDNTVIKTVRVSRGSKLSASQLPNESLYKKEGKDFTGWYTTAAAAADNNANYLFDVTTDTVTRTLKLYAGYKDSTATPSGAPTAAPGGETPTPAPGEETPTPAPGGETPTPTPGGGEATAPPVGGQYTAHLYDGAAGGKLVVVSTPAPEQPTQAPAEPTQAPAEPTQAPAEPTQAPDNNPPTGGGVSETTTWTFGEDTSSNIAPGTLDLGNGLSYIVTTEKSAYATGKDVGGITFPSRIKLGGKSTFDESKLDRVFTFTPAVAGSVTVYFTHGSSSGNPRSAQVYQSGNLLGSKAADPSAQAVTDPIAVAAGAPVYIGGDDNIGVYGITFTVGATSAGIVEAAAEPDTGAFYVQPDSDVDDLFKYLQKEGDENSDIVKYKVVYEDGTDTGETVTELAIHYDLVVDNGNFAYFNNNSGDTKFTGARRTTGGMNSDKVEGGIYSRGGSGGATELDMEGAFGVVMPFDGYAAAMIGKGGATTGETLVHGRIGFSGEEQILGDLNNMLAADGSIAPPYSFEQYVLPSNGPIPKGTRVFFWADGVSANRILLSQVIVSKNPIESDTPVATPAPGDRWSPGSAIAGQADPEPQTVGDLSVDLLPAGDAADSAWEVKSGARSSVAPKTADGSNIVAEDGTVNGVPGYGSAAKISAAKAGALSVQFIDIGTPGGDGKPKTAYIIAEAADGTLSVVNSLPNDTGEKLTTVLEINAEPGVTYYAFVQGSGGTFGTISFDSSKTVGDNQPTQAPAATDTPAPAATDTPAPAATATPAPATQAPEQPTATPHSCDGEVIVGAGTKIGLDLSGTNNLTVKSMKVTGLASGTDVKVETDNTFFMPAEDVRVDVEYNTETVTTPTPTPTTQPGATDTPGPNTSTEPGTTGTPAPTTTATNEPGPGTPTEEPTIHPAPTDDPNMQPHQHNVKAYGAQSIEVIPAPTTSSEPTTSTGPETSTEPTPEATEGTGQESLPLPTTGNIFVVDDEWENKTLAPEATLVEGDDMTAVLAGTADGSQVNISSKPGIPKDDITFGDITLTAGKSQGIVGIEVCYKDGKPDRPGHTYIKVTPKKDGTLNALAIVPKNNKAVSIAPIGEDGAFGENIASVSNEDTANHLIAVISAPVTAGTTYAIYGSGTGDIRVKGFSLDAATAAAAAEELVWDFAAEPFVVDGKVNTDLFPEGTHTSEPGVVDRYNITATSVQDINGLSYVVKATGENNFQSSKRSYPAGEGQEAYEASWSIKTGGASADDNRYFTFTPAEDGTFYIWARSGSSSNPTILTATQNGATVGTKEYAANSDTETFSVLAFAVNGGAELRISGSANTQFYKLKYTPGGAVATEEPTQAPSEATDAPAEPSSTPTETTAPAESAGPEDDGWIKERAFAGNTVKVTPLDSELGVESVTVIGETNKKDIDHETDSNGVVTFTMPEESVEVIFKFKQPTPPTETTQPGPGESTEPGPGETTEPGPGETTEPGPGETTEPGPGETTEPGPGETTEPGPGETTEPGPGETTEPGPGESTEPGPGETTEPGPGETTEPGPGESTEPGPGESVGPEPTEPRPEGEPTVKYAVQAPAQEGEVVKVNSQFGDPEQLLTLLLDDSSYTTYAHTYKNGFDAKDSFQVRIQDRPNADNPYGTKHTQTNGTVNGTLKFSPTKPGTLVIYYRRQADGGGANVFTSNDGKDLIVSKAGEDEKKALPGETYVDEIIDEAGSVAWVYKVVEITEPGDYAIWARGTTVSFAGYEYFVAGDQPGPEETNAPSDQPTTAPTPSATAEATEAPSVEPTATANPEKIYTVSLYGIEGDEIKVISTAGPKGADKIYPVAEIAASSDPSSSADPGPSASAPAPSAEASAEPAASTEPSTEPAASSAPSEAPATSSEPAASSAPSEAPATSSEPAASSAPSEAPATSSEPAASAAPGPEESAAPGPEESAAPGPEESAAPEPEESTAPEVTPAPSAEAPTPSATATTAPAESQAPQEPTPTPSATATTAPSTTATPAPETSTAPTESQAPLASPIIPEATGGTGSEAVGEVTSNDAYDKTVFGGDLATVADTKITGITAESAVKAEFGITTPGKYTFNVLGTGEGTPVFSIEKKAAEGTLVALAADEPLYPVVEDVEPKGTQVGTAGAADITNYTYETVLTEGEYVFTYSAPAEKTAPDFITMAIVPVAEEGFVTAIPAHVGDTIQITPAEGAPVTIKVTPELAEAGEITVTEDNTFTMPASNVRVDVTREQTEPGVSAAPTPDVEAKEYTIKVPETATLYNATGVEASVGGQKVETVKAGDEVTLTLIPAKPAQTETSEWAVSYTVGDVVTPIVGQSTESKDGYIITIPADLDSQDVVNNEIDVTAALAQIPKTEVAYKEEMALVEQPVTWDLQHNQQVIHFEHSDGNILDTTDKYGISFDTTTGGGKVDNRGRDDIWGQVNGGTTITIPVTKGAKISMDIYAVKGQYTIGGVEKTGDLTDYEYTGDAKAIDIVAYKRVDNTQDEKDKEIGYISTIKITYPAQNIASELQGSESLKGAIGEELPEGTTPEQLGSIELGPSEKTGDGYITYTATDESSANFIGDETNSGHYAAVSIKAEDPAANKVAILSADTVENVKANDTPEKIDVSSLKDVENGEATAVLKLAEESMVYELIFYKHTDAPAALAALDDSYQQIGDKIVLDYTKVELKQAETEPEATASTEPSATPTTKPEVTPSTEPSATPSAEPSATPTVNPEVSAGPEESTGPSTVPETSAGPSEQPSADPTIRSISGAINIINKYSNQGGGKKDNYMMKESDLVLTFKPADSSGDVTAKITGVEPSLTYSASIKKDKQYTAELKDTANNVYILTSDDVAAGSDDLSGKDLEAKKTYTAEYHINITQNAYNKIKAQSDLTKIYIVPGKTRGTNYAPDVVEVETSKLQVGDNKFEGHNFEAQDTNGETNNWGNATISDTKVDKGGNATWTTVTGTGVNPGNQDNMNNGTDENPTVKYQDIVVYAAPTKISVTEKPTIKQGTKDEAFTATFEPAEGVDTDVKWSVAPTTEGMTGVTISGDGKVTVAEDAKVNEKWTVTATSSYTDDIHGETTFTVSGDAHKVSVGSGLSGGTLELYETVEEKEEQVKVAQASVTSGTMNIDGKINVTYITKGTRSYHGNSQTIDGKQYDGYTELRVDASPKDTTDGVDGINPDSSTNTWKSTGSKADNQSILKIEAKVSGTLKIAFRGAKNNNDTHSKPTELLVNSEGTTLETITPNDSDFSNGNNFTDSSGYEMITLKFNLEGGKTYIFAPHGYGLRFYGYTYTTTTKPVEAGVQELATKYAGDTVYVLAKPTDGQQVTEVTVLPEAPVSPIAGVDNMYQFEVPTEPGDVTVSATFGPAA